jgi:hypothetical protein
MSKNYRLLVPASFLILSILACTLQTGITPSATSSPIVPAPSETNSTPLGSLVPAASATPPATSTVVLTPTNTVVASPTAVCDQAAFVSETVPDGSTFAPGAAFVKTWRLKNSGTCTWTSSYALVFASGNPLGAPASVPLAGNVAPGQQVDLTVNMQAPATPGSTTSNWELRNASGVLFGLGPSNGIFWVKINVVAPTATSAPVSAGTMFVHVATPANIISNYTIIDNPLTNNKPNLLLFITQNWNPGGGVSGIYNPASVGVWYDNAVHKWSIFNEDHSAMPVSAAFNVWIPSGSAATFIQTATVANSTLDYTLIDDSRTNNKPNLTLQITQNWNPGGGSGTYNTASTGVWYDNPAHKASIFNEDQSAVPVNAAFNVLITAPGTSSYTQTASVANIASDYTIIDNPLTNNNPNAILFVTQNWNPGGGSGTYNNVSVGVWYDNVTQKWAIFNEDQSAMPVNAAFNVIQAN